MFVRPKLTVSLRVLNVGGGSPIGENQNTIFAKLIAASP